MNNTLGRMATVFDYLETKYDARLSMAFDFKTGYYSCVLRNAITGEVISSFEVSNMEMLFRPMNELLQELDKRID